MGTLIEKGSIIRARGLRASLSGAWKPYSSAQSDRDSLFSVVAAIICQSFLAVARSVRRELLGVLG
jgi:hypothetical protein